jgi:hypothetical protein
MAKAAQAPAKGKNSPAPAKGSDKGTAVATRGSTDTAELTDDMRTMMSADAGTGVSTAIEDNVVPLIYILQALSPQVQRKKEEYVEDAEAGNIWFRGTKQVVPGDEGIPVVPCFFQKVWIEWMPNRGGFVARHDERPDDAVLRTDSENPKRKFWVRPNGNIVVETREHVVLVLEGFDAPMPFVIPMSGSGHSSSRNWMGSMNRKLVPGTDLKAPSYGYIYRMKTVFRTNDQGDWYMWEIVDENDEPTVVTDPAVYRMARQIELDFGKGKLKAGQADIDLTDTQAGAGGGDSAAGKHI